ncbi:glycosyltransferase involved in cell wall biosynthesis [Mycetocola sp. CAN_C7]|uniref:glycosyltransferase family 4 protein n=1 Tax=Mycetocola sp. CAN_C7 TaxID=2787724 RepID=UPI0018C9E655
MHIVQVLLSPRIGGAETLASELEKYWLEAEVTSTIIYLDQDDRKLSPWRRLYSLRRALQHSGADVVLSHSAIPSVYARIAAPASTPVIPVLHSAVDDFQSRPLRLAERALQMRTARVIAVSTEQANRYVGHFPSAPRPTWISNGIREDFPVKSEFPDSPRTVTTIARIAAQKQPRLWIETAASDEVVAAGLELSWWGPLTTESANDPEVSEHIKSSRPGKFMGPTTSPSEQLLETDIFFHPSANEAHSISVLEAAAVGLPIVCHDDIAVSMGHGLASATFGGPDGASPAQALADLVDNWPRSTLDRVTVAELVRAEFGMQHCSSRYLEVCREVVRIAES